MAGVEHGQVAVATTTLRWIPELLSAFCDQYPAVRFRLIQPEAAAMREQLEREETDLGLSAQPIEGPGLAWKPVLTEEILLAVPATHRFARRSAVALRDAECEPFVSLKRGYAEIGHTQQGSGGLPAAPTVRTLSELEYQWSRRGDDASSRPSSQSSRQRRRQANRGPWSCRPSSSSAQPSKPRRAPRQDETRVQSVPARRSLVVPHQSGRDDRPDRIHVAETV
jgi:DNA-binding transcriptional LysR family regulator